MFEWNKNVQKMLDCVEENLNEVLTLKILTEKLNYSTYYCTKQFHKYVGISLRNYISLRKVSAAVIDLRDTKERILDIAVKYGFSSQEAFTRSFVKAYGITPSAYRKMTRPLPLLIKHNTYNPYYLGLGEIRMKEEVLKDIQVRIRMIPEHKFIGIRNLEAHNYFDFWSLQEKIKGLDCYTVCGFLESIKSYNGQVGGWFYKNGKTGYIYGIEVSADYNGYIPQGMECILIPESLYVVFYHPPYDYSKLDASIYEALKDKMNGFNPSDYGFEYNDTLNTYQRHEPEYYGQAFCRPIRKI